MATETTKKMIPDEVRDLFREAALANVPQLVGCLRDDTGGFCAVGYIEARSRAGADALWTRRAARCHLCGATTSAEGYLIVNAWRLLVHLNNEHRLGWLDLAKVPEPGEEETTR